MIVTRRQGAVLTIAFDRPAARNAITEDGWKQLIDAAAAAAASDAAVVLLASDVAGIFSSGADLSMLAGLADSIEARTAFRLRMKAAVEALAALPMPSIAAVDGGCYGAAVALTLACDLCIAGDDAIFATTPAKLGIGYPGSDVARLTARVGRGQAARMLFTAQAIDANEAVRIGLADLRAPSADAMATMLAGQIAANAPGAVRLLKRTLGQAPDADEGFDAAFGGDEFRERLAAFRKRLR